jgi:hypothetical protein
MHWISTAATLRGDRPTNQDQIVVVDGAAAVLDGATSWLHTYDEVEPRDGGWYARMLGHALTARLPGRGVDLAEILAAAIADVRDAYGLRPGNSPYSTAGIVRWSDEQIELLVLGDSPAMIGTVSGTAMVVADDRLARTAPDERAAYRDHLRDGHGFDQRFAGLIAEVQRRERHSFNRPGGFWVAEADPAAAAHAVRRTVPISEVRTVALLSDGAAAGVTDYDLTDWIGLAAALDDAGAAAWLRSVHQAEQADPDGKRWPRTKCHDDKSVVSLSRM